jgi:poly(glycerol-phosphate) alpha-glucosyltransferase
LHALCAAEATAIRAFGLRNPICTIPNGVDLPPAIAGHEPPPWAEAVSDERRVLLYLGRIHPKKGLANLLHAWAAARAMAAEGAWTLVIAGWDQGGHAAELAALSTRLELKELVCFTGPLYGTQKVAAYRCANAFVLPSLSEGLPLVVLEAWSYARPVVLTSACNLPEGAEVGAALTCHPDVPGLTEALRDLLDRSDRAREEMGLRGRALVAERFTWSGAARQMAQVYRWSRGLGGQPDCVSF